MPQHLTLTERKLLSQWLLEGTSKSQIARQLGPDRRTIQRELQRNSMPEGYSASEAQAQAEARRRQLRRPRKMDQPKIDEYVRERLVLYWSPDQIAQRAKRDFRRKPRQQISRQTIYNWIQQSEDRRHWESFLRFGPRRRGEERRGKLSGSVSIAGRPKIVDRRSRYGDWEGDTVVGRRRRGGLLTLVDRKSGYLLVGKVPDLRAPTINRAGKRVTKNLPPSLRHTLTLDNGKEFADHEQMSRQLAMAIYFAEPYCAWQRGTNENTNGLIRQFFPKGTDFAEVSHQEVARVENLLNERPRKRLGYRTPQEVLAKKLTAAIVN